MARQGSLGQSCLDRWAIASLRWSILVSIGLIAASVPAYVRAKDPSPEFVVDSPADQTKKIRLVAGTSLRIVQANEKMPWVFQVQSTSESDPSYVGDDPLTLQYSIHQVDLGHKVLSGQRPIAANGTEQSQTISLDDRAPKAEGVYEVRFQLVRRSDKLWARLRPKEVVLEELRVPMLVQLPPSAESPRPTQQSASWQTIGKIRPSETAMALGQWLPDSAARLIPGVRYVKGNLQKGQANGQSISIVQPKSVFQAKLPIMAIGYPHRITIRCPRSQARGLRIDLGHGADQTESRFSSIVQSRDNFSHRGTYHRTENDPTGSRSGASSDDQWLTRTYLYYPQPDDQVWLTNLNESESVAFESVTVTAGPATSMNLTRRQSVDGSIMREIVLSISDPSWIQTWTEDWQPTDESSVCESRSNDIHRSWLAAHRVIEQAQQMGASSASIPVAPFDLTSSDATLNDQVADIEAVAFHVFDRFDIDVKPLLSLRANQADSLEQTIRRFSEFRCFDGLAVTIDQQSELNEDTLGILQRVSRAKRLLIRADGQLEEKTQREIAGIEGAILIANHDCSGPVHPASEFASAEPFRLTGVAMVDHPIASQDPAACLFEIIHRSSPSSILIDDAIVRGIVDTQLSRISRSFRSLPVGAVNQVASLDPGDGTCQIVRAIVQDRVLLSLSNLAPWNSIIKLEAVTNSEAVSSAAPLLSEPLLSDTVLWERIDDESFESINGLKLGQGFNVAARDTVLLRSRFPVPQHLQRGITSWRWSARVAGGDWVVDQIKKDVTGIVERVGMLSDPVSNNQLNNGSFETVGEMGLVGWLHAQHPPGCVVVDSEKASDGAKSIRLKTDQAISARTWLVSDMIDVPASGRLAVSMALRGGHLPEQDSANPASPKSQATVAGQATGVPSSKQQAIPTNEKVQHLRVSLEGTQAGVPIRKSADVEIQRSETWEPRRIVLEVDAIDPTTTNALRLTIDSMTPGLVWIDDVRLHDDFSTARERTDLQKQAFLAVEGLHRGNLTPSASLLMNRWASRLLEQSHQAEEISGKPSLSAESAKSPLIKDVPEVANRNRAWLLERLRF